MPTLATIGYEGATIREVLDALAAADIDATDAAQTQLAQLIDLIRAGKQVCILCFEADPAKCHRRLVARAVIAKTKCQVVDLIPAAGRLIPD